jgi:Cyclin
MSTSVYQVLEFYSYVFTTAQMEKDTMIFSLFYIERLLTETAGQLRVCAYNWRSVLLSGLALASKVWDDLSMWSVDFAKVSIY